MDFIANDSDDRLWADLEQLTLESGTAALSIPTEFHQWIDLPLEILPLIIHHMEFDSLMKLRGSNSVMKTLVEDEIYEFDYVKCTHWATHQGELHFHAHSERHGKELDSTLENELFDHDYGFVPYSHVLQFIQQVLRFGRTQVLDVCYVPRHSDYREVDEEMGVFLEQIASSAPFRFTHFILDGPCPQVAQFFLANCSEHVESIQFYHDSLHHGGVPLDIRNLMTEPKFMNAESVKLMSLNNESYSQACVLMIQKWIEDDAKIGKKLLVSKCLTTGLQGQNILFQRFEEAFQDQITNQRENYETESGELWIQMSNTEKKILVKKVEAAAFCVIVPASLQKTDIPVKLRKELEWLQHPILDESEIFCRR